MSAVTNNTRISTANLGLITKEQYISAITFCSVFWILLSSIGVISNIINIRTFIAMGLSDSVTVSFLALAIFDLFYVALSLSLGVTSALYVSENVSSTRFSIEPYGVSIFFFNIMILLNVSNMLMTTYIAVARCMCVAKPLQFKNAFTRRRAIAFMLAISVFAIACYTPILVNMKMVPRFELTYNKSRPSLWVSPRRESIKIVVWVFVDVVLPFTTQILVIICVVIMAKSLNAASKFRKTSTTSNVVQSKYKNSVEITHKNNWFNSNKSNSASDKIGSKDLRVVQQVVLISMVYIVCNAPKILISVATTLEPEFTIGKRYTILYLCVNSLGKHFEVFNSTVNLFIYIKYNTKFRSMLTCDCTSKTH